MYNVLTFLENSSLNYPDKTAVKDNNSEITYKELVINAKRIGTFLSEYDVRRKPVVVYGNKSVRVLTTFFGIVYAGGFYVLIDPSFPKERVMKIFNVLKPSVVITDEDKFDRIRECEYKGTVLDINSVEKDIDEAVLSTIRKNALDTDPLYGIFTSGSTGDPKCVVVCHRSVIDFINVFTETFGITDKDVIGNQAPFDFDVSVKDIYSCIKTGATLIIIPKEYFMFPNNVCDMLDDNNVTTLIWAVSALCLLNRLHGLKYKVPSAINKIMFSGEMMPIKQLNAWRNYYPDAMFVNLYGPTEITCNCTYHILDREYSDDDKLPMGKAFPNERVFLLDENDKLPRIKQALLADAIATSAGAVLGTSTTTTFVESASGVSEGGRTGLTAVTTAILFGLSLFLSPIFLAIPSFATAPALVIVGLYMLSNVISIDFSDMSEAIPCYVCIIAMPFFYSISEGISMGIITYVAINLITGKAKEKKISALMYVLAVLFILKYIFL